MANSGGGDSKVSEKVTEQDFSSIGPRVLGETGSRIRLLGIPLFYAEVLVSSIICIKKLTNLNYMI